jgi:glycine/D-amino acid oxidase-like deaminating enzyme
MLASIHYSQARKRIEKSMTKEDHYDVAIIGVGAAGSAALYQLSQKKLKILAIDSFEPPHNLGSSGGESRIVRQAIGEGEHYVPLALRSYEIWSEIEQKIGHQLLHRVGGLVLSSTSDGSYAQTNDFFRQPYNLLRSIIFNMKFYRARKLRRGFQILIFKTIQ